MAMVAFLLGLAVGVAFWVGEQLWLRKQLRQFLGLQIDSFEFSVPMISRLRRAIASLEQQQQLLEAQLRTWQQVVQLSPIGYLQVDEENQLLWCNEQAQQLLQIQKWDPSSPRLLLKFVRSYELDQLIDRTRQQQKPGIQEWVFHLACQNNSQAGKTRSLALRGYSYPLTDGQVGVFLENRQALVTLSQNRDRWISDLAHELKTPLTSIRLVAEALQQRLDPPWSDRVERLLGETNRLIQLVQDWLALSHMEVDPGKNLSRKPLELQTLIQSVWQTLEPLARQKQLNLHYSGPDVVWLAADESHLYRVFLNIIDNSIRYSPERGTIQALVKLVHVPETREIDEADGVSWVQIDMIDSGSGFSLSDLPYVFDRLYRGDPARSRQAAQSSQLQQTSMPVSAGCGLGLAIAQQIIEAHGGFIQAKNHPETGGAWLQIQLPCPQ